MVCWGGAPTQSALATEWGSTIAIVGWPIFVPEPSCALVRTRPWSRACLRRIRFDCANQPTFALSSQRFTNSSIVVNRKRTARPEGILIACNNPRSTSRSTVRAETFKIVFASCRVINWAGVLSVCSTFPPGYLRHVVSTCARARPRVLVRKLALTLVKITLEATKHLPNLFWLPQIGQGIGERVVISEAQQGSQLLLV